MARELADREGNIPFTSQEQAPQWLLYPGSVEHWRTYMQKYMPIRSFFDEQSQVRNLVAAELGGVAKERIEEYAAPVYWVPRHAAPVNTGLKLRPVRVVRCRVGEPTLALDFGELETGLYAIRVIGAAETSKLRGFREPLYVRVSVNDGPGGRKSAYRVRIGYCDEFYSVAEVYFHAGERRRYAAEVMVDAGSRVEHQMQQILPHVIGGERLRRLHEVLRELRHSPNVRVLSVG